MRKLAFLLEEFARPSPGQQLLDRFLAGYVRDGAVHRPDCESIAVHVMLGTAEPGFEKRVDDRKLKVVADPGKAVQGADAIIVVPRKPGAVANERFLEIALQNAPAGSSCFVYGVISNTLERGRELARLAQSRNIALRAGTPFCVTWHLPEIMLPPATALTEALVVVQVGASATQASPPALPANLGGAELHALESLAPILENRPGGEAGVRKVRFLEGDELWRAGNKGLWSWPLLASALSRSDTPQGDALVDGRTQDLVGLGLVQKLARNPRGWLLEHSDGLRTAILVLDGVVNDFNYAVRARDDTVSSAQVFRAPPPAEHHFTRLTAVLADFFQTQKAPWRLERNLLIAGLLESFKSPSSRSGQWISVER